MSNPEKTMAELIVKNKRVRRGREVGLGGRVF